jgi:lysophospholipase L1-like esterase
MDALLQLFVFTVFAAESVISPLPDAPATVIHAPMVSFGQLSTLVPPTPAVLGDSAITSEETETPAPTASPTPTPVAHFTVQSEVTIALLGDSMIDTLGPDVPNLQQLLSEYYPETSFRIKNFGVGGTNIDYGIERITSGYTYLGQPIPSLESTKPDVVVLESFGYNPFPVEQGHIDRHWMALAYAVDTIKQNVPSAKIIIGATIAPNSRVFGDGAAGLSFDPVAKQEKVARIDEYVENAIKFAKSQHLPLADAYDASRDANGNGKLEYINGGDHIHYSEAGRQLFAQKVFDAVTINKLLE